MAHNIENIDGKDAMVYAGDMPWHTLGRRIPDDLTPQQALESAGLNDWDVHTVPLWAEYGGGVHEVTNEFGLVRGKDEKLFGTVPGDWKIVQNEEAFEFFNDFAASGEISIHTAGSLHDGKIVWVLAKTNESFEVQPGDRIDAFLLLTNYFKYGFSTDVRFTPIRVVCANTHVSAMHGKSGVRVSHRRVFDGDEVKRILGVSKENFDRYKHRARYLAQKVADDEDVIDYFKRVFPLRDNDRDKMSRNAELAMSVLKTQPGAELSEGTWWSAVNAVTYLTDHKLGRSSETRLASAWYGANQKLKEFALDLATDFRL